MLLPLSSEGDYADSMLEASYGGCADDRMAIRFEAGDIRNLNNPLVRLLIAKATGQQINGILRDYQEGELAAVAEHLSQYGGGFWKKTVQQIHGHLDRSPLTTKDRQREGNIFQRAKAANNIEEIAARHTALQDAGLGRLRGLCPIHEEKTASFYVYDDDQRWHCFGACGAGGDVIELTKQLMRKGKWIRK